MMLPLTPARSKFPIPELTPGERNIVEYIKQLLVDGKTDFLLFEGYAEIADRELRGNQVPQKK